MKRISGNQKKKNPSKQMRTLVTEWMTNRVLSHLTNFLGHINLLHRTHWAMTMQNIAVAKGVDIMMADS